MRIASFSSYTRARAEAEAYCRSGKRHPGAKGKEYRVYAYYGEYHLWCGYSSSDFPSISESLVFSAKV